MGVNASHEKETQVIESESNKLNVSDKNCSYCNKQFTEELWCKNCDPFRIIKGWTSGNPDIDKFIRDTMYNARNHEYLSFIEWVPFDRFTDIKQIGEGGFAKVYTAMWIDGPLDSRLEKRDDGSWKRYDPELMKVALKRLDGSQNMSAEYFKEVNKKIFFYFNILGMFVIMK